MDIGRRLERITRNSGGIHRRIGARPGDFIDKGRLNGIVHEIPDGCRGGKHVVH